MKTLVTLIAATCLLQSGCTIKTKTDRMLESQPPAYADGYRLGCDSGYAAAGSIYHQPKKDVQRMLDDKLYAMGWNDGFAQCKGSYEANVRSYPGGR